jgi:hypothetical protein
MQVYGSAIKGPGAPTADKPIGYWSDLLRGYELTEGVPTPLLNRPQVEGREQVLRDKWRDAPVADRAYVEESVHAQDQFLREQTERMAKENQ